MAEETAVPTAEPQAPVVPPPPEAVPTPEPEPSAEPEESGAPEGEEEAPAATPESVRQAIIDRIDEVAKEDPELAESLRKRLGGEEQAPDERIHEAELKERIRALDDDLQAEASSYYVQRSSVGASAQQWAQGLAKQFGDATQELADGKSERVPALDAQMLTSAILHYVDQAAPAARRVGYVTGVKVALEALESHPTARHLTKDDRTAIDAAAQTGDLPKLFSIYLDAALHAAPDEVKRQAKKQADAETKSVERMEKLLAAIGSPNGRKATASAPTSTSNDFETLEHLYATGEATPAQETRYRQLRAARGL